VRGRLVSPRRELGRLMFRGISPGTGPPTRSARGGLPPAEEVDALVPGESKSPWFSTAVAEPGAAGSLR